MFYLIHFGGILVQFNLFLVIKKITKIKSTDDKLCVEGLVLDTQI